MAALIASPDGHGAMVASWRALAGHTCRFWEVQFALPAGGAHHCFRERRAASFAASLAAGVYARTAAAGAPPRRAIGRRKGDRSITCPARRRTVDSDAVLLRARHGGRHEGGGRRQRKRDEKLVHLGCTFKLQRRETPALLECVTRQGNLERDPRLRRALCTGVSGLRAYTSGKNGP